MEKCHVHRSNITLTAAAVKHHAVALEKQERMNWMGWRRCEEANNGGWMSMWLDAAAACGLLTGEKLEMGVGRQ